MPWLPRKALGVTDGGDGGRAHRGERQPVGRNRALGPREVDCEGVEESLQLRTRRGRYGIPDRPVH